MNPAGRTVISGWSAISPFGLRAADFTAGLRAAPDHDEPGGEVPGFDIRELLGRKGTRAMDRQTGLAVATAGQLLTGEDGERIAGVGPDAALVIGTNTASAQSMMDFARDTLTQSKPYHVDPKQFPNTVLNTAAARSAIWHQLTGPNATVSAGRASGLLALNYARRLRRAGRAEVVLCGAVEELSPARRWLEADAGTLGEGCAMVLLEPAGRPTAHRRAELAELLALEFGVAATPADVAPALTGCVRRACIAAGESPDQIWAVARCGGPDPECAGEADALTDLLGDKPPVQLCATDLLGDTHGASAAFGLVALLATAAGTGDAVGRTALVTAADRDGALGCALLRLGPHRPELDR
ncbi:MAG: beta-ketoacyl synthase N-terminal-like domain-containing protein [Micromonosporaceae bacterium]